MVAALNKYIAQQNGLDWINYHPCRRRYGRIVCVCYHLAAC
jgi:hypothetical protein